MISIQTKDGSNPQYKSKFYVCLHPDDHAEHFSRVASELWGACDAALCYDAQPLTDAHDDTFLNDLQEMRLLVVVVTKRFLNEPSAARDAVLPFFISRHVPILPLMREDGLDARFGQVMGERQYLSISTQDTTALPYEYKLKRFIQTLLPDDDTIEQIRGAFRGHIFISYRKVDRAEARRLISTIRDNPIGRDAAIWYDEFLTPGEDFNQEIADAVCACDLFAMVLTPNTLLNHNYIIHTEYPFAQKQGKRVLPVECLPIDRTQLSTHFPNIPACIAADDTAALSSALENALPHRANDDYDPRRDYLIGLAHLYGIGAEPNVTRAFSRIATAARAGLTEAHMKLADMHWNGDGVPVNRNAAVQVLQKLLGRLQYAYEQSKKSEDAVAHANALARMAQMHSELHQYDHAFQYAQQARKIASELHRDDQSYTPLLAQYAMLCSEIGFRAGNSAKSYLYFAETFVFGDWGTDDSEYLRRWVTLALLLFSKSKPEDKKGMETVMQILNAAQQLYDKSGSAFDKSQLLRALLCAIQCRDETQDPRPLLERAFALIETMNVSYLTKTMQGEVAEIYLHAAICAQSDEENDAYVQKAIQFAAAYPDDMSAREMMIKAYMSRYAYLNDTQNTQQAALFLEQAIALTRAIAEETGNVDDYQALFLIESRQYPQVTQDANRYIQFHMKRWEALCKAHPENKQYKQHYRGCKRVWRWRIPIRLLSFFKSIK